MSGGLADDMDFVVVHRNAEPDKGRFMVRQCSEEKCTPKLT